LREKRVPSGKLKLADFRQRTPLLSAVQAPRFCHPAGTADRRFYKSVDRLVTLTRWSNPAFVGLKQKMTEKQVRCAIYTRKSRKAGLKQVPICSTSSARRA
jgi:hypothetical protein